MISERDEAKALWDRGFKVTREPKDGRLARQILDPCYFRDAKRFYDTVADHYSRSASILVTTDEVEGIARLWADRANLTPIGPVEITLFEYFNHYATRFSGWGISGEAMVLPMESDADDDVLWAE